LRIEVYFRADGKAGPIMSDLPKECTCAIEIRYGTTEDTGKAVNLPVTAAFTFCPLHEAAPELYAALSALWNAVVKYDRIGFEGSELLEVMWDARGVLEKLSEQMGKAQV
jgi:hypothetical protein